MISNKLGECVMISLDKFETYKIQKLHEKLLTIS